MTEKKDFLDIQEELLEYIRPMTAPYDLYNDLEKIIKQGLIRAWRAGYVIGYNDGRDHGAI